MSVKEWFSKRDNQDRTIFLLYLVLIAVPMLMPLGLPFPIEASAIESYEQLENVEPGGILVLNSESGFASYAEIGPGEIAIYRHAFKKVREDGCKIICFSRNAEGFKLSERYIEMADTTGLTYGEDWVEFGYISGGEAVLSGIVDDLETIAPKDKYGTNFEDLPMLQNIRNIDDYDYMYYSTSSDMPPYARQWGEKAQQRGIPVIMNILSGSIPLAMPYYTAGTMTGYMNSVIGGAGYEKLIDTPGMGISLLDAQSTAHLLGIVLLLVVQGYNLIKKPGGAT
jgi:hypothetical protein